LLLASPAAADIPGQVFDWGPDCYGWEDNYDHGTGMSTPGANLTIVRVIDNFFAPLDVLDPTTTEYTFIFDGLVSNGTVLNGPARETTYNGGFFRIYEDSPFNFDFGTNPPVGGPTGFEDGTLILEGFLANFYVQTFPAMAGFTGTFTCDFEFTGPAAGPIYSLVEGCYGTANGGWSDDLVFTTIPDGYDFVVDGHFTVEECRSIDTDQSSWGGVKNLFR